MLVLYHDVTSPASAVAVLRLQAIADAGGQVHFTGIDAVGVELSLPVTLDQLAELERERERALELGLPLRRPSRRPPTLTAHLVGDLAEQVGLGAAWRWACLTAYWTRDLDLGDEQVLLELARDIGLAIDAVLEVLGDPRRRTDLRQRFLALRRRGVGGVPVLEVDGTFLRADLDDADLRRLATL